MTTTIKNNLQLNREKALQRNQSNDPKQSLAAGFEYAVQTHGGSNGTILAERRWRELRRTAHTCFKLVKVDQVQDRRLYQQQQQQQPRQHSQVVSLRDIESGRLNAVAFRTSLPLPLPVPENNNNTNTNRPITTTNHSRDAPARATNEHSKQQQNENRSSDHVLERIDGSAPTAFLSPSRRIRNRHNAVYGQHLPTAQNSPGCAVKVFGNQVVQREERTVCQELLARGGGSNSNNGGGASNHHPTDIGRMQQQNNAHATARAAMRVPSAAAPTVDTTDIMDDELDALIADIDENQLVSSRSNGSNGSSNKRFPTPQRSSTNHNNKNSFDYGTDWNNNNANGADTREISSHPGSSFRSSNSNAAYSAPRDGNSASYGGSSSNNNNGTDNRYSQPLSSLARNRNTASTSTTAVADSHSNSFGNDGSNNHNGTSSHGQTKNDYGNSFGNESTNSYGRTNNDYGNSNSSANNNSNSYGQNSNDYGNSNSFGNDSNNSNSYGQASNGYGNSNSIGNDNNNNSYGQTSNDYAASSSSFAPPPAVRSGSDSAPLCPGHNVPCRSLTASTSTNAGRQFYKCSLPEDQQCDFFQWQDGMESNWNDDDAGGVADADYNSGELKDMFAENRRKFGHPCFRPGQQQVIEHAIQGRDVFVLMPTGGGKSLCYQLPAWCCPGLAVVVSPLLSLVQDQVQSMTKLGVESVFLNSSQDYHTEQIDITRRLKETTAHTGVKLLYVTPEKLQGSGQIQNILRRLYNKGLLSRFVIDVSLLFVRAVERMGLCLEL